MNTAAKVAERKRNRPELYCPAPRCLWLTGDGSLCPRHAPKPVTPEERTAYHEFMHSAEDAEFLTEMETRMPSAWSETELARYCELTGQQVEEWSDCQTMQEFCSGFGAEMRLISKGNKRSVVFRGECRNCGATFEADRSEQG